MVVMPALSVALNGVARTSRRSDKTRTGPLHRLLVGHFRQLVSAETVSRPADGSLRRQQAPAVRFGSGRAGDRAHPTSVPFSHRVTPPCVADPASSARPRRSERSGTLLRL